MNKVKEDMINNLKKNVLKFFMFDINNSFYKIKFES